MKTLPSLIAALLFAAGCISNSSTPASNVDLVNVGSNSSPTQLNKPDEKVQADKKRNTPAHFKNIDFKNLSYAIKGTKELIRLRDGEFRHRHETNRDLGDGWVTFRDVSYADVTGDKNEEAIVQLTRVECGGSCDGGSALFYFYSITNEKLKLLSRIETGSIAYTCGLKSFILKKDVLTLEAFRNCRFDGLSLQSAYDADQQGGKFIATEFTRFVLRFNGKWRVITKEILPNSQRDVKNYSAHIEINND